MRALHAVPMLATLLPMALAAGMHAEEMPPPDEAAAPAGPPLRAPTHHGLIIRVAGPARAPLLTSHERPSTDRCARYVRAVMR